jgi:hypothetical protein
VNALYVVVVISSPQGAVVLRVWAESALTEIHSLVRMMRPGYVNITAGPPGYDWRYTCTS